MFLIGFELRKNSVGLIKPDVPHARHQNYQWSKRKGYEL
jgi:hypothetical protein